MKELFDRVCLSTSQLTAIAYSTSFSTGIRLFKKKYRSPVYAIYGFVRFADEIVDTFIDFNRENLFYQFKKDTYDAISAEISMNPILHSFQMVVNKYHIEFELIEQFMNSMEMDLFKKDYNRDQFNEYVLGSAEVIGLMCLKVFLDGDETEYQSLKPSAMKLGSAFQKINFLRDLKSDYYHLGRSYFPNADPDHFNEASKKKYEMEIENDFKHGRDGISRLPGDVRFGVYMAYAYYYSLFKKIRRSSAEKIMKKRFRISNFRKYFLLLGSFVKFKSGLI